MTNATRYRHWERPAGVPRCHQNKRSKNSVLLTVVEELVSCSNCRRLMESDAIAARDFERRLKERP